jgi:DNA anti-recombination protein RmuC
MCTARGECPDDPTVNVERTTNSLPVLSDMDIAGTKKRIQRLIKVAEESYKRINSLRERMDKLQTDLESTSSQVDHIGYELAEQRVLLEALAEQEDIDVETLLEEADLPPEPDAEAESEDREGETAESNEGPSKQATSRPSAGGGE